MQLRHHGGSTAGLLQLQLPDTRLRCFTGMKCAVKGEARRRSVMELVFLAPALLIRLLKHARLLVPTFIFSFLESFSVVFRIHK